MDRENQEEHLDIVDIEDEPKVEVSLTTVNFFIKLSWYQCSDISHLT